MFYFIHFCSFYFSFVLFIFSHSGMLVIVKELIVIMVLELVKANSSEKNRIDKTISAV